jgi:DNA-binding GntR family transcriptional regulator
VKIRHDETHQERMSRVYKSKCTGKGKSSTVTNPRAAPADGESEIDPRGDTVEGVPRPTPAVVRPSDNSVDITNQVYTPIQMIGRDPMKTVNSDIAYDYLRKRILSGEYPPGTALMTNVLAPEIRVSRTPIRDALRQLEADGLVTIQPRLGASVKKMDLRAFRETCELRLALETHTAGLAARSRTDIDLHEIRLALDAMRGITGELVDGGSAEELIPALIREDVRFHLAIISAAKNDLMKKEILRLHLIKRVVSGPASVGKKPLPKTVEEESAHRRAVLAEHAAIYEAIEAGDSAGAKRAMEEHIQDIIDRSIHQLARATADVATRELSAEEAIYSA